MPFVLAGNRLLIDPDTMWQITIGQWIVDHGMVPHTDVYSFTMRGQPWISTQWLAQVAYAAVYSLAGWAGPVVLASACIAATFALFTRFLALAKQIGGAGDARPVVSPPRLLFPGLVLLAAPWPTHPWFDSSRIRGVRRSRQWVN